MYESTKNNVAKATDILTSLPRIFRYEMAGRPRGVVEIVPQMRILNAQQILGETYNFASLLPAIEGNRQCVEFLAERHLLANSCFCGQCGLNATLVNYRQGVDGCRWACRPCGFRQAIRARSFFHRSHLTLRQIIIVIYCWSYDMPQTVMIHEADVDKKTVVDWCNFLREESESYIERHTAEIGGIDAAGEAIVVEIDESKYFHRKYHRGAWHEGHWVFGGVERESGKCFLVEVPDRTAATLQAQIEAHILPGSHIISDGWAAYAHIDQIRHGIYTHAVVVHQHHFVDPNDAQVHTQTVENMWMRAKRKLRRQYGTSRALFESYLHEFMFRNLLRDNKDLVFSHILSAISESYPL